MAVSFVQLTPSFTTDVFGIYLQEDNSSRQVFKDARPLKAEVSIKSKPMEQPLENGATVIDHRIILPIEIDIELFLPSSIYRTTIDEIKQLYSNASFLIVHTRSGIYDNLFIQDIPNEESSDKFDSLTVKMKLKEAMLVTSSFQPVNIVDRPTVSRGNISSVNTTPKQDEDVSALKSLIF